MKKLSKFLDQYGFGISLNMNDVFCPASDCETIEIQEIPGLLVLEEKFGWDGVKAFVGAKRKADPNWRKKPLSKNYLEAREYITENFVFDKYEDELLLKSLAVPFGNGTSFHVNFEKFVDEENI